MLFRILTLVSCLCVSTLSVMAQSPASLDSKKIVLIAGETAKVDKIGHHDYLAGCQALETLLRQTPSVQCVQVRDGWPSDEAVLDDARAIVFYTDGGGKQAFLETDQRVARLQALVSRGVGLVMIHQAVDFPDQFADKGKAWLGGAYLKNLSGRGHWDSSHVDFPEHPVTRGVTAWKINDGWLNEIQFVDGLRGVTPLVWSGKKYAGSRAGLDADIVGWVYDRPDGGRSFSFTGLDAHSAWSLPGMRQLIVNGVLWTAGAEITQAGAKCAIESSALEAMQTPREPPKPANKQPANKQSANE